MGKSLASTMILLRLMNVFAMEEHSSTHNLATIRSDTHQKNEVRDNPLGLNDFSFTTEESQLLDQLLQNGDVSFSVRDEGTDTQIVDRGNDRTCKQCGKILSSKYALRSHKKTRHGIITYVCMTPTDDSLCLKTFLTPIDLYIHRKQHTFLYCPVCNKWLAYSEFAMHCSTIHASKSFFCFICNPAVSFGYEFGLYEHLSKAHAF